MSSSWLAPPDNLKLTPDHIDIWRTSLDLSSADVNEYFDLLDDGEKNRVDKYKSSKRSNEFIITRGLLRKIIAGLFKVPASSFQFKYTDKDKPFLTADILGVPLSFNISHSSSCALIAIGLNRDLGIDIEKIREDIDFMKLARRFFSKKESESLGNYPNEDIPSAFFSCWSRKEAFVKAIGDGISFGLSEFSISISPDQKEIKLTTHYDPIAARSWSINNISTGDEYMAAICSNRPGYEFRLWQVGHKSRL
jgi:4'-phosphopantetheinyl transferase